MQFNSVSTPSNSLYHDCLFKLGIDRTDTTTYPIADFTRSANNWYRRVNSWIWKATGEWEYDDSNYTDLPIATTTLVDGQQDYGIPSTAQKIDRIEVLDAAGDGHKLTPIDKSQYPNTAMTELEETDGLPQMYDMVGNSIMLYPAPATASVTESAGLRIYFTREISEFLVTDTTKEAGFVDNFHEIISIGSALDFSTIVGDQNKVNELKTNLNKLQEELQQFYGSRERELKPRIRRKYNNNKRK